MGFFPLNDDLGMTSPPKACQAKNGTHAVAQHECASWQPSSSVFNWYSGHLTLHHCESWT